MSVAAVFMSEALAEARQAGASGEIPIGAVIVRAGQIIARARNSREATKNPLHHAEIQALETAALFTGDWRLNDCDLYVTLEPCPMCLGALFQARIGRLIFGCHDDKREAAAGVGKTIFPNLRDLTALSSNNHTLAITSGVMDQDSAQLLRDFFAARRKL